MQNAFKHPSYDPLFDTKEAAAYIKRHEETLKKMARFGEIASVRSKKEAKSSFD